MAQPLLVSKDDVLLPFAVPRERVPSTSHFRGTWLTSSVEALKKRDLFDRYLTLLPKEHHGVILTAVASEWLPIDLAMAHYTACDGLRLAKIDAYGLATETTSRVHGTSLGVAVRLAKQSGVTPWSVLGQIDRLWVRVWMGGGIAVYKQGPKEAVVDVAGWPVARIGYVRTIMPAVLENVVALFCTKAYVSDVPSLASSSSLGMRLQWA